MGVMKITAIKQQVKRSDRYSIYLDEKYTFSLGESDLLRSGLRIGQELDERQVTELQDTSRLGKLYDQTLNLLSFRPRSEWELRDYLKRKKQAPQDVDETLNKLSKSGYVDDKQFAQRWVENRRLLKPISKRRLQAELKQKRVPNPIIDEVLEDDETDEREVLRALVARKTARYPDRTKFMQYLARQGYNYDDIKAVLADD